MGIEVRNLVVDYGKVRALDNVSFGASDGEFLVILGPSGCGKTTALRCIAGLLEPTGGDILINGRRVNGVYPSERNIAMVFQNYALYPHMTVYDNIALNMRMKMIPKSVIDRKVKEVAEMLRISDHLHKRPRQLSGGQAQRVGLARAMVREPAAFLMDEPLSNLDAKLRNEMRDEMKKFQELTGKTIVYVTHDQIEAMTLGDRIVVMNRGRVIQIGSPKEMFDNPEHQFIAGFLGNPPMNLVNARVTWKAAGSYEVSLGNGASTDIALDGSYVSMPAGVVIGIRPTDIVIDPSGPMKAKLDRCELLGAEMNVHFDIGEAKCIARLRRDETNEHLLSMKRQESVRFHVDGNRLYLFDQTTGSRIYPSSGSGA